MNGVRAHPRLQALVAVVADQHAFLHAHRHDSEGEPQVDDGGGRGDRQRYG
jgi:hypothetical protein